MDLGLHGKVAIVTGGTHGIGHAIALMLADEGASVAVCARTQVGIDTTLAELASRGSRTFGQVADVTRQADIEAFVAASVETLGNIDILVNNVGGAQGKGIINSTDEQWLRTFDINLFQTVRMSRAVLPSMRQQGQGSIVIISSISGYKSSLDSQYGSAKSAEIFLSQSLALELAPLNIRVNTLCPGSIIFPDGGWERRKAHDPQGFERFQRKEFPMGRLGTPEEVARVAVFVASPAASWINGAMIAVDGAQQRPTMF